MSAGEAELDDSAELYGEAAVKVVKDGYNRLNNRLKTAQETTQVPKGILVEVLPKWSWAPPLLNAQEYERFCELTRRYTAESSVTAIWYILEHACGERRLLPAITIESDHGQVVVVLR